MIAGRTFRISNSRSAAPDACETSPHTSESWPRPAAANTAYSTNCDKRPALMRPASTSCAPTHSTTTTLAKTRKMAIAVRTARAWIDSRGVRTLELTSDAAG